MHYVAIAISITIMVKVSAAVLVAMRVHPSPAIALLASFTGSFATSAFFLPTGIVSIVSAPTSASVPAVGVNWHSVTRKESRSTAELWNYLLTLKDNWMALPVSYKGGSVAHGLELGKTVAYVRLAENVYL
jgi:hypothetical protein